MFAKKILAVLLVCIIVFSLIGCTPKEVVASLGDGGGRPLVGEKGDKVYVEAPFVERMDMYMPSRVGLTKDGEILVVSVEQTAPDAWDEELQTVVQTPRYLALTFFDREGNQLRQVKTQEIERFSEVTLLPDRVLFIQYLEEGQTLCELSFEGKISEGIQLPTLAKKNICALDYRLEDCYLACNRDGFYLVDAKGEVIRSIPVRNWTEFTTDSQDKLHCLLNSQSSVFYAVYDLKTGDELSRTELALDVRYDVKAIRELAPGKVYLILQKGLRLLHEDGSVGEAILTAEGSSLAFATNIVDYMMDPADGSLIYMTAEYHPKNAYSGIDYSSEEDSYTRLVKFALDDARKYGGKKILRVGTMRSADSIDYAAAVFEKQYPDWKVVVEEYAAGYEFDNSQYADNSALFWEIRQKMGADLMTGKGPDVFLLTGLPFERYAQKNVLVDLSAYIARDLPSETYFTNIIDAFKMEGKNYVLPMGYTFDILYGLKGNLPDQGHNIAFDDFMSYVRSLPEGNNAMEFRGYDLKERVFETFLACYLNEFIDARAKKVDFDSSKFRTFVSDVEELRTKYGYSPDMPDQKMVIEEDGSIRIMTSGSSEPEEDLSPLDMMERGMIAYTWGQSYGFSELRDNYARFGEDLRYTLMPNMDNGKNVFRATDLLGINTTAADKEIAWQFLMAFIKSSSQNGMPMDRTVMQGWVDRLLNPTDEDKMHYNGTIMVDGKKRQAHMLTKEWIEGFVAVIESLNATVSYDNTASEILRKEMKPFYEDKKTIEDVIPIIQNHMSTYVNE